MQDQGLRVAVGVLLLGMLFVLSLHLLHAPGTGDVRISLRWMQLVQELGLAQGYAASIEDFPRSRGGTQHLTGGGEYPPLGYAALQLAGRIGEAAGLPPFLAFKLLVFACHWVAVALLLWLSRDVLLAAGFAAATLLGDLGLGYLDALTAPWLIAGFWMLRAGRPVLGVALVMVGALFKWQPLVILPFVVVQALGVSGLGAALRAPVAWRVAAVGLAVVGLLALAFGPWPFVALGHALSHPHLSANALNLPWLLGFLFRLLLEPEFTLGTEMHFVTPPALGFLVPPMRLAFWAAFGLVLLRAIGAEKTAPNCLRLSILGFVTYFALGTGVHENHLHVPVVLGFLLAALDRSETSRLIALLLAVMLNVNLFFFYGVSGTQVGMQVLGLDLSLALALLFVAAWTVLLVRVWRLTGPAAAAAVPAPAGAALAADRAGSLPISPRPRAPCGSDRPRGRARASPPARCRG